VTSKLRAHEVAMLRHVTNYIRTLKSPDGRLLARSYASLQTNIRREAFDEYRVSTRLDEQGYPLTENVQTTTLDTSFGTLSRTHHDTLAALDKKIKLDSDAFPILRKEEHFETWIHAFTAQCRLQGTSDTLDEAYHPSDTDETLAHHRLQTFMYTVLDKTL
jgi:hypothetical protein